MCENWTYGVNCKNSCLCNQTQAERLVEFVKHKMSWTCSAMELKAVYLVSNTKNHSFILYGLHARCNLKYENLSLGSH